MLKRSLTIGLIACVLVVTRAGDASACSCASLQPADALAEFDAAFVGRLIDRPPPAMPFVDKAPYRFEVEAWVKGDLGTEVVVFAPSQGGACGFEAPIDERVGVFVTIEGGTPVGSLCTMVDPDLLLAGDTPLVLDGSGPPLFLVTGYEGPARLMLLDAAGGLLTFVGNDDEVLTGISVCPGARVLAEVANDQLVVRSVADLGEIRRVDLDGLPFEVGVPRIWCRDPEGATVLLATDEWTEAGGSVYRLLDSANLDAPLLDGEFGWMELGADYAVAGEGPTSELIWRINLETKEPSILHKIPVDPGDSNPAGRGWVNNTGDRAIITQWRYRDGVGGSTTVFLYDLTTGEPLWQSPALPTGDGIGWVDDTKFLAYSYPDMSSDQVDNLIIDTVTFEITHLAELPGFPSLRSGDQLVGVTGATLKAMPIGGGIPVKLRVLPSETHQLAAVLDPGAAVITTATNPGTTTIGGSETNRRLSPGWFFIPVLLAGVVGFAVWQNRSHREPSGG